MALKKRLRRVGRTLTMTNVENARLRLLAGIGKPIDLITMQAEIVDIKTILDLDYTMSEDLRNKYQTRLEDYQNLILTIQGDE
jgi:S-adenosylmethionine synthetase